VEEKGNTESGASVRRNLNVARRFYSSVFLSEKYVFIKFNKNTKVIMTKYNKYTKGIY